MVMKHNTPCLVFAWFPGCHFSGKGVPGEKGSVIPHICDSKRKGKGKANREASTSKHADGSQTIIKSTITYLVKISFCTSTDVPW